eukprot:3949977-Prymnesium_polylepis.1
MEHTMLIYVFEWSAEARKPFEAYLRKIGVPMKIVTAKNVTEMKQSMTGRDSKVLTAEALKHIPELLAFVSSEAEEVEAAVEEAEAEAEAVAAEVEATGAAGGNKRQRHDDDDDFDLVRCSRQPLPPGARSPAHSRAPRPNRIYFSCTARLGPPGAETPSPKPQTTGIYAH